MQARLLRANRHAIHSRVAATNDQLSAAAKNRVSRLDRRRGLLDGGGMVRLHPLPLLRHRAFAGLFWRRRSRAEHHSLATFAIAYLLRPLGGFVFGHIGDRFGRRRTMLLSVALMTVTMLGTALLPTHAQVGAAAGWLLFLLRCVMGFSVGGEYIAVVAYLLEGAPRNRRGLITSLASASSEIGRSSRSEFLLLTVNSMSVASLDFWGMAHPFSRRRGVGGKRGDRPHDDGRIAGFRTAAGKRDRAREPAALRA